MKPITFFYLERCPYCRNARRAMQELTEENPEYSKLSIRRVEESQEPELADRYDYYFVPTMFVGEEKRYESHSGEGYESIRANVKRVFDEALAAE